MDHYAPTSYAHPASENNRDLRETLKHRKRESNNQHTSSFIWRQKTPTRDHISQEVSESSRTRRPPLERNLEEHGFPPPPPPPTTEEILGELREVTVQYTSCTDSTESAARRQRVIQGEARRLMAETAANILAAISNKTRLRTNNFEPPQEALNPISPGLPPNLGTLTEPPEAPLKKRRGWPPLNRNSLQLTGAKTSKRKIYLIQNSPKRRSGHKNYPSL